MTYQEEVLYGLKVEVIFIIILAMSVLGRRIRVINWILILIQTLFTVFDGSLLSKPTVNSQLVVSITERLQFIFKDPSKT